MAKTNFTHCVGTVSGSDAAIEASRCCARNASDNFPAALRIARSRDSFSIFASLQPKLPQITQMLCETKARLKRENCAGGTDEFAGQAFACRWQPKRSPYSNRRQRHARPM